LFTTLLCLLAITFTAPAKAEIPPEWFGVRIMEARIAGEQAGRVDDASIGIVRGEKLTRGLVRAAIMRLLSAGRFADVQVEAVEVEGGLSLLFHVVPRLVIRRIEVAGNRVLQDRDVVRLLGVHEDSELERELFPKWVADVQAAYQRRGYPDAGVRIVIRDMDDIAQKVLRVEIEEREPMLISKLEFAGDSLPRRKGLRRLLGFHVGDVADLERIEGGLERAEEILRRQGYYRAAFDEPRIERWGRQARVVVPSHIGPAYEVRFRGNAPLGESELFSTMALHEERISSEANLRALEQKLEDTYRRYSFRDADVQIVERVETRQFVSEATGETWQEQVGVLDTQIVPGTQIEVEAITFPGAAHFEAKFLRTQLYSYLEEDLPGSALRFPVDSELADELGFGGGGPALQRQVPEPLLLDPRRMFYAPSYEQAIEHLRELYRADGYLDVKIAEVELSALERPGHVVAVISVDEGPRTFLYDIRVEKNHALSSFDLLSAAGLSRGTPFGYLKLEEARLRIVEACQEKGYFYAKVEPQVRTSADGTRAEVVFHVEEGYPVRIGAIEVRGAERSSKAMILNRVRFKVGDLYRPSVARDSQDSLLALDVFTSVTVAPDEPDLPARLKRLVVSVSERKTQWLGWSAGFSTGEGMRGGFEYGYRNLFSSAVHASFRGQIGYQFVFLDKEIEAQYLQLDPDKRIEYQTTLTFGVPYIRSLPKNTASLDLTVLADIQRDFRIQKQSAVFTVLYRPIKRVTLSISEELESSDFKLLASSLRIPANIAISNLVPSGQNTLLATQLTLALDLRDRAYNPRRGVLLSFSPEYDRTLTSRAGEELIGLGEEGKRRFKSNMLRLIGSFAFYIPLGDKLTFASQWRYGRIVHFSADSRSYPNRLFYLGGPNFRGYNINQVIPQDLRDQDLDENNILTHGGETFMAGQNELRFPIVGDLYGGLFTDIGNLWYDPRTFDVRDLMFVYGAGLRLQTPIASLAFDYGVREFNRGFDLVGAFQFAFQTF
jgi:outer membrane protein assembly factor BamA